MPDLKPMILAVDDDLDLLETYQSILRKKFKVLTCAKAKETLTILTNEPVTLILLDIRMPDIDGIKLLKMIRQQDQYLPVIMVTASRDISSAVEAMKLGAFHYVVKPFDVKELQVLIEKALEKHQLIKENLYLRESLSEVTSYLDLIGKTPAMLKLYKTIESVAPTSSTVLIHGESGTGKELVARAIHKKSQRANQPFIAVNCAAIPESLFESELFGHERGAFTGALERKLGKFELADNGTFFLDEIGCLPAPMQAKLLRVIEDQLIERVGGEKIIPVDLRLISATNIDFQKHIEAGKFRADLYYRLNVIPVNLPPLRERKNDIPLFVEYFTDKFNKLLNKGVKGFSAKAKEALINYNWPGNVRELQNLIERVIVLSQEEIISLAELSGQLTAQPAQLQGSLKDHIDNYEKEIILNTLTSHQGNLARAARILKTPRTSLITRMNSLGIKL